MSKPARRGITLARPRPRHLSAAASLIFFALLLTGALHAQLPAGTRDAAEPRSAEQDPLRTQASEALDKQDYPTALKLLTNLTTKNPTDAHLLYNLALTQDALDQASAADATYRRAIAADATYFEPHLALGLLLARGGKLTEAREQLALATTFPTDNTALKARAYRALARIDQTARPGDASSELLSAIKISPETPDDILFSGELAESAKDLPAAESAYRRLLAVS
ncbi:MAG TPA: tetratricopeptide repeat protein, partial [Edaphobacter sp.]|nr:tetratricopeptide repeat protein [Edaphobacter sp.]